MLHKQPCSDGRSIGTQLTQGVPWMADTRLEVGCNEHSLYAVSSGNARTVIPGHCFRGAWVPVVKTETACRNNDTSDGCQSSSKDLATSSSLSHFKPTNCRAVQEATVTLHECWQSPPKGQFDRLVPDRA